MVRSDTQPERLSGVLSFLTHLSGASKLDWKPRRCCCPALLIFVIVQRLPETDPDIEQTQAAAQAPEKTVVHNRAQGGKRQQQVVVGPLRCPRQNNQEHSGHGTDQDKKEN